MGNHDAGRAMVQTATALAGQREKTGQTALEILDIACQSYKGCDAEFDDATRHGEPFCDLITEAFMPEGGAPEGMDFHNEVGDEWWYEHIYRPFTDRYKLC